MRTSLFLTLVLFCAAFPASGLEVSTQNNIGGYFEYAGFTIVPAGDAVPARSGDLSAARAFEILRPGQQAFTVGRLYTSCNCFQIEIGKKRFMAGERAIVTLRNVRPTTGRNYPFYIQIGSPLRVVLRHDAYIISDQYAASAAVPEAAPAIAGPVAVVVEAAAESVPAVTEAAIQTDADAPAPQSVAESADVPASDTSPAQTEVFNDGATAAAVVVETVESVETVETASEEKEYVLSDQDLLGK